MASREAGRQRKIDRRSNFFGGPMRGGSPDSGIQFPDFSQGQSQTASATNQGAFVPPGQQQAQQEAFASAEFQQPSQGQGVFPPSQITQPGDLSLLGFDDQLQQQSLFQGVA